MKVSRLFVLGFCLGLLLLGCGGGSGVAVVSGATSAPVVPSVQTPVLVVQPGSTYTADIDATGAPLTIIAQGATITGKLTKRDHSNKLTLIGGTYTQAPTLEMVPSTITSHDFAFAGVEFRAGLRLVGTREGIISACQFGGTLYLKQAVSPIVAHSVFIGQGKGSGPAVFYDGQSTGFDAGLVLDTVVILGWDVGVDARYNEWLRIVGSTIDYNEGSAIVLSSQNAAQLDGNYLGSKSSAPALHITQGTLGKAPDWSAKITVTGNQIVGHAQDFGGANDYDAILIDGDTDEVDISHNHIDWWTRYGVAFTTNKRLTITGNSFAPLTGISPVRRLGGGDSQVLIADNTFPPGQPVMGTVYAKLKDNRP